MKKTILNSIVICTTGLLLSACDQYKGYNKEEVKNDCSAIFETTTYVSKDNKMMTKKDRKVSDKSTSKSTMPEQDNDMYATKEKPATTCKILTFKIDSRTQCEIVGSDKMDNLAKILDQNQQDKIILVVPEKKVRDLGRLAQKYMVAGGLDDIQKYFDSDLFKSIKFPYKGMNCKAGGMSFAIWTGGKKVTLIIED